MVNACSAHDAPLYAMPLGRLGQAVGKEGRMVVCIGGGGMAQKLLELLRQEAPIQEDVPTHT